MHCENARQITVNESQGVRSSSQQLCPGFYKLLLVYCPALVLIHHVKELLNLIEVNIPTAIFVQVTEHFVRLLGSASKYRYESLSKLLFRYIAITICVKLFEDGHHLILGDGATVISINLAENGGDDVSHGR